MTITIVNVYKDKSQMESMNNKPQSWWVDYMKKAHKEKLKDQLLRSIPTKRSIISIEKNRLLTNREYLI